MDEAPSAPSAAPPSSRRWRRDACRDRIRDRFGSPTRLTKEGAPAGSCLCLDVFPSRAVLPSRAARPSQSRLGAHQVWSRGPSRPNEPPHAGGAVHNSSRTGGRSARGGPRVGRCCRRRSGDPTAREPVRFGRGQPWEPRLQAHPPSSKGGQTSTFSRAEQPYRRCSAAPHFCWPGAFLGKPRGLPRLNDPPHAGRGSPLAEIRARRRAVPRPHDVSAPASSQARDLAGPPGTKADEARLLGGGGGGPHRCPRPGVESCRPPVSGPSTKEGDVNPPVTSGSATKIALVTAMLDGRCLFSHFHENRGTVA